MYEGRNKLIVTVQQLLRGAGGGTPNFLGRGCSSENFNGRPLQRDTNLGVAQIDLKP